MSGPETTGCDDYGDRLVELVCDELSAPEAERVRAHAQTCAQCRPALRQLQRVMSASREVELLTPSLEVERAIMQAARVAAAGRARSVAQEPMPSPRESLRDWLGRLASWAMSPQVAMASVLLLMVGIGLYAIPLRREAESVSLKSALEEPAPDAPADEPSGAASAASMPSPAEERQEAADEQHERDAERAARDLGGVTKSPSALRERSSAAPRAFPLEAKKAASARKPEPERRLAKGASEGGSAPLQPEEARPSKARGENAFAPAPPVASSSGAPAKRAAQGSDQADRLGSAFPGSAQSEKSASADDAAPTSKDKAESSEDPTADGVRAAQSGDYARAIALLEPLTTAPSADVRRRATRWLAFSLRAKGDCAKAAKYYRALTYPVSVARDVLEEAADCQDKLGNPSQATRLRSRARNGP